MALLLATSMSLVVALLVVVAVHHTAAPTRSHHPGGLVHGLIEGIASPCSAMNFGPQSVEVEALRGSTIVAQATTRGGAYRFTLHVPPGSYLVRSDNGMHAHVVVADHHITTLDLSPGCKSAVAWVRCLTACTTRDGRRVVSSPGREAG
jgi:hypothetical protein